MKRTLPQQIRDHHKQHAIEPTGNKQSTTNACAFVCREAFSAEPLWKTTCLLALRSDCGPLQNNLFLLSLLFDLIATRTFYRLELSNFKFKRSQGRFVFGTTIFFLREGTFSYCSSVQPGTTWTKPCWVTISTILLV